MRKFSLIEGALELVIAGHHKIQIVKGEQENIVLVQCISENALREVAGQKNTNGMRITFPETGGKIILNGEQRCPTQSAAIFVITVPKTLLSLAIFAAGAARVTCDVPGGISISGQLNDYAELEVKSDADLKFRLTGRAHLLAKYTLPEDAEEKYEDDDDEGKKPLYGLANDLIGNKAELELRGASSVILKGVFDFIAANAVDASNLSIEGICQNELYLSSGQYADITFTGNYAEEKLQLNVATLVC